MRSLQSMHAAQHTVSDGKGRRNGGRQQEHSMHSSVPVGWSCCRRGTKPELSSAQSSLPELRKPSQPLPAWVAGSSWSTTSWWVWWGPVWGWLGSALLLRPMPCTARLSTPAAQQGKQLVEQPISCLADFRRFYTDGQVGNRSMKTPQNLVWLSGGASELEC